jgi:hypothetical protein
MFGWKVAGSIIVVVLKRGVVTRVTGVLIIYTKSIYQLLNA